MTQKMDLARDYHERGFNCAQSVLTPFAQDYGLGESTALLISTGFGSGMGRLCEVCGALTGAFMAIGLKYGRAESDGTKYGPKTEHTYRLVAQIAAEFRRRHGSIYCRDLVGRDLSIPAEREKAKQDGVFASVCSKCIVDAAQLAEQTLRD